MGYKIKDIARVDEPRMVSLSDAPNHVQISSKPHQPTATQTTLSVKYFDFEKGFKDENNQLDPTTHKDEFEKYVDKHSTIIIEEGIPTTKHVFKGTRDKLNVNATTYYIAKEDKTTEDQNSAMTIENLKSCLISNIYLSSNYQINNNITRDENNIASIGNSIQLTSLGGGSKYKIALSTGAFENKTLRISGPSATSNQDSIDGGSGKASIELEVYITDADSLLGDNQFPDKSMGTYMTTLRKSYHGQPLWFDLNALMSNRSSFSNAFLNNEGWVDAGTATGYRFIARRFDGANREPFYLSDVLYNITGYNRNLEIKHLDDYVYDAQEKNFIKALTNQPTLTYVKGQAHYFNFILSDNNRQNNHKIGITYRLYSQSKAFIAEAKTINQGKKLAVVNTIKLNIDQYLNQYSNVGYVEVYLNVDGMIQSLPLTFQILPHCLYEVNDFAFLNALGGWSSFNFGGSKKTDFKATGTSIYKTQTPQHTISSEIESVYSQDIQELLTVKTIPINSTTVEWLKEMSASIAVYELSTKRYIIVDEMNIKQNSKDELFEVEMKYRYSDAFNGRIK